MKTKNIWMSLLALIGLSVAACTGSSDKTVDSKKAGDAAKATETSATYALDTENSTLNWKGSKLGGAHMGTIAIKEGSISTENGQINAGSFVIDMASMEENTDDKESAANLIGHLKSGDFFMVDTFPTAAFSIVKVVDNTITGNLEIKGITKEISFPAEIEVTESGVSAAAAFSINRMDWGIVYGNGSIPDLAKDKVISDDIEFIVSLKATK